MRARLAVGVWLYDVKCLPVFGKGFDDGRVANTGDETHNIRKL
jgi:hypothetical protein